MDDTCVVIESARKEEFLDHINRVDPHIQFTSEDAKPDGSMPFLDTIVVPQPDKPLTTTVYRKPTHTDLYLHWDSNHHLSARFSVINTLRHRVKTVCSSNHLLKEEEQHLNKALRTCKYPGWALNRGNIKQNKKNNKQGANRSNNTNTRKPYIVIRYLQGMSESCKTICRKHGVEMYFKGGNTIRDLLVHPRTRITYLKRME